MREYGINVVFYLVTHFERCSQGVVFSNGPTFWGMLSGCYYCKLWATFLCEIHGTFPVITVVGLNFWTCRKKGQSHSVIYNLLTFTITTRWLFNKCIWVCSKLCTHHRQDPISNVLKINTIWCLIYTCWNKKCTSIERKNLRCHPSTGLVWAHAHLIWSQHYYKTWALCCYALLGMINSFVFFLCFHMVFNNSSLFMSMSNLI